MLDKKKIEDALIRSGLSNKRSKKLAIFLQGEDLLKDNDKKDEKTKIKSVQEVVKFDKEDKKNG